MAVQACAARRLPSVGRGRGGRSRRASCAGRAGLPQRRHANGSTHMCCPAPVLRRPWLGRAVASHELHGACRSSRDRDAPMATHTCAARRWLSAGCGRGGQSHRASCTGRAGLAAMAACRRLYTHVLPGADPPGRNLGGQSRSAGRAGLAAIATRQWRHTLTHVLPCAGPPLATRLWWHTHVLHCAGPPPAVAGEGRVARAARTRLTRSQSACCCKSKLRIWSALRFFWR
jgi:hypothetical protein